MTNLPIRTKLIALAVASVVAGVSTASTFLSVYHIRAIRNGKVRQIQQHADALCHNASGSLSFSDVPSAEQLLASLASLSTIEAATLYDADARTFASYRRADQNAELLLPNRALPAPNVEWKDGGALVVWRPVIDNGEQLGVMSIRDSMEDVAAEIYRFQITMAIIVITSVVVAGLLAAWLQRSVSGPILYLAELTQKATALGDYSLRAERRSTDELGALCDAFNDLLAKVATSQGALRQANAGLEARVAERTAELSREIEQRKTAQRLLEASRDAAEAANEAKSRFLANMSHELRTPLNGMLGFSQLLECSPDLDAATRADYIDTIQKSGEHLLALVNDVLDLSRIEAGELNVEQIPCSPHELVNHVVSVLRVKALEKDLTLDYGWSSECPQIIITDPLRFKQLLTNLVGNAIKFTTQGAVGIDMSTDREREQLVVKVTDSGIGIASDKLSAIFDPFVQADTSTTRKHGGTGLGLAISRRLAHAMGGELSVDSQPGEGSRFAFRVATGPLDDALFFDTPPTDAIQPHLARPGRQLASARILLVEDGSVNRKLIQLMLRQSGAEVTTAENGRLGVDAAMRDEFDLILMDMQMPILDGYAATRELRKNGLKLPIIALTAHAMEGDREKCLAAGCTDYLTKPVTIEALTICLAETLGVAATSEKVDDPTVDGLLLDRLESDLPCADPDFRELVEEFIAFAHDQVVRIEDALGANNMESVISLAHSLKGAGGTAGFPDFTEPTTQLLRAARAENIDDAVHWFTQIKSLAHRIAGPSQEAHA